MQVIYEKKRFSTNIPFYLEKKMGAIVMERQELVCNLSNSAIFQ